jgi:hypothetical protein
METTGTLMDVPSSTGDASEEDTQELLKDEIERAILQIWREVFRLIEVQRDSNFFELGGNSLLAMELTERLAIRLGLEIPVLLLFQHPSVRAMAEIIADGRALSDYA